MQLIFESMLSLDLTARGQLALIFASLAFRMGPGVKREAAESPEIRALEETWRLRQRCEGQLCPWGIMDARHGYLEGAQARFPSSRPSSPLMRLRRLLGS